MNSFARVAALAAFSIASVGASSAATVYIGSYGVFGGVGNANYSNPGFVNTVLLNTIPNSFTYNIGTGGGVWAGPLTAGGMTSSWVSASPFDCPNCGPFPTSNGTYTYTSTFNANAYYTGTITVLADDTTSVYLNGTLITAAAPATTTGKCTTSTPNCVMAATYNLSGFITGTNTLTFGVQQIFGSATGVDFAGALNTVPEPNSLMLLGTGLVGSAGMFFRRLRSA